MYSLVAVVKPTEAKIVMKGMLSLLSQDQLQEVYDMLKRTLKEKWYDVSIPLKADVDTTMSLAQNLADHVRSLE